MFASILSHLIMSFNLSFLWSVEFFKRSWLEAFRGPEDGLRKTSRAAQAVSHLIVRSVRPETKDFFKPSAKREFKRDYYYQQLNGTYILAVRIKEHDYTSDYDNDDKSDNEDSGWCAHNAGHKPGASTLDLWTEASEVKELAACAAAAGHLLVLPTRPFFHTLRWGHGKLTRASKIYKKKENRYINIIDID